MGNFDWSGLVSAGGSILGGIVNTVAPGIGTAVTGLTQGISQGMQSQYEVEQQIASEERAEQRQIASEQRANAENDRRFAMTNAEYDRRIADERAYNDPSAQAARMRAAGINPMAQLGSGGVTSSTSKSSAPSQASNSQSSAPMSSGVSAKSLLGLSQGMQLMKSEEEIEKIRLENEETRQDIKNKKETQQTEYQKGYQTFINNAITEWNAGDMSNFVEESENVDFTFRYNLNLSDSGLLEVLDDSTGANVSYSYKGLPSINIEGYKPLTDYFGTGDIKTPDFDKFFKPSSDTFEFDAEFGKSPDLNLTSTADTARMILKGAGTPPKRKFSSNVRKWTKKNDHYGDFSIYSNSYLAKQKREEYNKALGENEKLRQDIELQATSLLFKLAETLTNGRKADADAVNAYAKHLETSFKYGDNYNAKFFIQLALQVLSTSSDVGEAVAKIMDVLLKYRTPPQP